MAKRHQDRAHVWECAPKKEKKMIVAFAPKHNRPGYKDATGAFIPEMNKYKKYHQDHGETVRTVIIDNHASKLAMKREVFAALRGMPLSGVAFFCHGFKNRIQFGIGMRDVGELAKTLDGGVHDLFVTFYACDAARDADKDKKDDLEPFGGDGGFADEVRDQLCMSGKIWCKVDSHTTAAHTTKNPNVRRFAGVGVMSPGAGGSYIVSRGGKLWPKWVRALRTDFRYEFPQLDLADIHERLVMM